MYSLPSSMRKMLFILILLLLLSSVTAERVTLGIGESYTDEDKNITLLKIEDTKTLVCVNNQKGIVAKNKRVDINGVILETKSIYGDNTVKFDIEVPNCYKCSCIGDCLNQQCQNPKELEVQQIPDEPQEQNNNTPSEKIELVETPTVSILSIIAVILVILVSILGIYILWKKVH